MSLMEKECVICYEKLTRSNVGPACIVHPVHTCYECVMKLRTDRKRCPICRGRLLHDNDMEERNMSWSEFFDFVDNQFVDE